MKILFAEDDSVVLLVYKKFAKSHLVGDQCFFATNGAEAIDILMNERIDIVITDMQMPQKNGLDVLDYSKNKNPQTQVFIVTAVDELDVAVTCMRHGAHDYIEKPVNLKVLKERLEGLRGSLYLKDENEQLYRSNEMLESEMSMLGLKYENILLHVNDVIESLKKMTEEKELDREALKQQVEVLMSIGESENE